MADTLRNKRSTTLRREYINLVLGGNKYKLGDSKTKEYYKKYEIDSEKCAYCGDKSTSLDHIYSTVKGKIFTGYTNELKNLLPACSSCNSSKRNDSWKEWLYSNDSRAEYARAKKGFLQREKLIENYIRENKSNIKSISKKELLILNKNCAEFEAAMQKCFKELDSILEKHRNIYLEMQKNKK